MLDCGDVIVVWVAMQYAVALSAHISSSNRYNPITMLAETVTASKCIHYHHATGLTESESGQTSIGSTSIPGGVRITAAVYHRYKCPPDYMNIHSI